MNIVLFEPHEIYKPLAGRDTRARHIVDVLRCTEGDCVRAGIINGPSGHISIGAITNTALTFRWHQEAPEGAGGAGSAGAALSPVRMLIGLPRPPVIRRLLRDLSSIGVAAIILCGTGRTEKSYLNSRRLTPSAIRSALVEGASQGGVTTLPEVHVYRHIGEALTSERERTPHQHSERDATPVATDYEAPTSERESERAPHQHDTAQIVMVTPREAHMCAPPVHSFALCGAKGAGHSAYTVAIGPERGWSQAELREFDVNGFIPVVVGPRTLRVENIAVAAAVGAVNGVQLTEGYPQSYRPQAVGPAKGVGRAIR